ncbi:Putative glycosyltransferase ytcC GT4 [Thermobacillus xylanilyticus]|uniref:Glycosyltransferase n=2 Tax=Thermobacillus TaxID=76632 RepID=L0ECE7_THECK|nr:MULTISPECIES: glycosyltransferase family 4 protein [Thermobacillus]AGA57309.1 glycosyltransferase [Thermobacillus composti KWC4]CAG5090690.1 Putative glycosyltransferase ytcC GT4 [Thermobacillus xylanilyticus]
MAVPRVAFVTPGSFAIPSPKGSSVERVIEYLAPRLDRRRFEPRIYGRTGRGLSRVGSLGGVRIERFPAADKKAYVRAVGTAMRKFRPTLIQVENRPLYVLRLRRRFPRTKIWLSLQSKTFIGKRYISRSALKRSLAAADRVLVNSHWLRRTVAEMVPEAADKLRVLHLGVDIDRFRPPDDPGSGERRRRLREDRGWTDRTVVLFMGRLIPRKGVHHLLAILPKLAEAHPDVLLVIVGSPFYGSHRDTAYSLRLKRMARAMKRHVLFVPYVPYTKVPDWFLAADIAVVPSKPGEAFGLVNVEAMASGLPVVASRVGGIVEVVEDGETGYLVNPANMEAELLDRIGALIRDPELRSRMGAAGRKRVEEKFTWQRTAEAWMELYERG